MKCVVHTDQEAIAVCQSCGNALCSHCRTNIGGKAYCLPCIDSGRIHPQSQWTTMPKIRFTTLLGYVPPKTRRRLFIGIIGMILIGIFIHVQWLFPIGYFSPSGILLYENYLPRTIGALLIAIGICLSAVAWYELKSYFGLRWAPLIALFILFVPWWGVLAERLIDSGLVFVEIEPSTPQTGYLFLSYANLASLSSTCLVILMVLWSGVLLYVGRRSHSPKLAVGAGFSYIIMAGFMLLAIIPHMFMAYQVPFWILYWWYPAQMLMYENISIIPAFIFEIGIILNVLFFFRLATSR